jgi:hypothetical protein
MEISMKTFNTLLGAAALVWFAAGAAPGALAQDIFFAILSGASVCDKPGSGDPLLCRLGDLDGAGSATVMIVGPTSLCAAIIVNNLAIPKLSPSTAAHLHIGQASYSGPVVVRLAAPFNFGEGNPGTSMLCNNAVPASTISALSSNPQFYYIDVHSEGFQFGAVRGQLF